MPRNLTYLFVGAISNDLVKNKKLALILDLDNTLIHASPAQRAPQSILSDPRISAITFSDGRYGREYRHLLRRRDFLEEFLGEASKICQLFVYTLGTRKYAEAVVSVLDPDGQYFGHRIVSQ